MAPSPTFLSLISTYALMVTVSAAWSADFPATADTHLFPVKMWGTLPNGGTAHLYTLKTLAVSWR